MNRLGLSLHEALELARRPALLNTASPRLIMSHFVCADEPGHPMNQSQLALFSEIRKEFPYLRPRLPTRPVSISAPTRTSIWCGRGSRSTAQNLFATPPLSTVVTAEADDPGA